MKLDESCISNPKCLIGLSIATEPGKSNLKSRISDLRCRIRPISKLPLLVDDVEHYIHPSRHRHSPRHSHAARRHPFGATHAKIPAEASITRTRCHLLPLQRQRLRIAEEHPVHPQSGLRELRGTIHCRIRVRSRIRHTSRSWMQCACRRPGDIMRSEGPQSGLRCRACSSVGHLRFL